MRLYIDCSHVDFARQATGIPRVVLHYIEQGYLWSARTGVEVVPVVTTPAGLMPVRPMPGTRRPPYLDRFDDSAIETDAAPLLAMATHYLQSALVAANVAPPVERCAAAIRDAYQGLVSDAHLRPLEVAAGDVLFCPAYWHDVDPRLFRAVQRLGARVVTLVHDILPVTLPQFYEAPWKHQFEANLLAAMCQSDALLAVSNYTADSMREFGERRGLGVVEVGVAHNGYAPLVSDDMARRMDTEGFAPQLRSGARYQMLREEQPYLMVGSVEPKKGHIPVIASFEALWMAGLKRPLVIVGRKGWLEKSVVQTIRQSPFYNDRLLWFEDMDDVDLFYAYRHARALVFSSYAEGFGIPMVEAAGAGCPVIAYDTPISREVLGRSGQFFCDFLGLANHIRSHEEASGFAAARTAIAHFSWPVWGDAVPALFDGLIARFASDV